MPAPIVLGIIALCAGGTGAGAAASGIKNYWQLFREKKAADKHCQELLKLVEAEQAKTNAQLEAMGKLELQIVDRLGDYASLIEKIQNRPEFVPYQQDAALLSIPSLQELSSVTLLAHTLLGNVGGMAAGAFSGIAAAGAVPSIVAALGTASTGTSISALSGAAAWNAILASLGGGTLAAGGGGIALGTTILASLTGGIGILVGGVTIKLTGKKVLEKQRLKFEKNIELTEEHVERLCEHLKEIALLSERFSDSLSKVQEIYEQQLCTLSNFLGPKEKVNWKELSRSERLTVQNTTLLVSLLYKMCKMQVSKQTVAEDGTLLNEANTGEIDAMIACAEETIKDIKERPSLFDFLFRRKKIKA